ncbi:hypothetical protein [Acetilactobacillus jinshanensis]|uniref:DUF1657 domain-containing protein n=1 Tax=Acetilactobacillus jinshanensis TaxID=1720083 RepID=A0A4P6ZKL2_9LACO|nr:hypothetical protein [Acetilactobacillus jinshanensis]QBP18311.1 hypothetical protein ELX58_03985 [Acetilactobacillus jinshanensis]URL61176.1 hypothetical protein HGK75_04050 [uncultured bacterium]
MVDKQSLDYLDQSIDDLSRASSKLYLAEQNIKNENDNDDNEVLLEFIDNIYTNVMESMHELKAKQHLYKKYPNS